MSTDYGIYGNISSHSNSMKGETAKKYDIKNNLHAEELRRNIVESIKDDTKRMVRAFPTFKLYFVEEDAESWNLLDDFYGYNSVESIEVHKSKDNAADLAVVRITNFLGHLDNKSFESDKHSRSSKEKFNLNTLEMEDPAITDMYLYPGTQIQIKMGYSSNESELSNVFTGKITEISHGDVITFVAQGYGIELLSGIGYDWTKSKYGGIFPWRSDPLNIMNMLISSPDCKHFGRWGFANIEDGEILGTRRKGKWVPLVNNPQDDNIYLQSSDRSNWFIRTFGFLNEYRIYQTTIWDVFKDMQRRFPGYIVSVVPYDGRATLFFGKPNQLYNYTLGKHSAVVRDYLYDKKKLEESLFNPMSSKDVSRIKIDGAKNKSASDIKSIWENVSKDSGKKNLSEEDARTLLLSLKKTSRDYSDASAISLVDFMIEKVSEDPSNINLFNIKVSELSLDYVVDITPSEGKLWSDPVGNIKTNDQMQKEYPLATSADPRYKTFRNYHYKDSFHHIVSNNIKIDLENFYNRIIVEFHGDIGGRTPEEQEKANKHYQVLLADDSIPSDYWRTKVVFEENAERYYQARNYALGNLLLTMQKLYDGELNILGDPEIKPYDYVFINDPYTNMYGPVEVREVVHSFSRNTGFVTTIIPDLVVHVNNPQQISDTWFAQAGMLGMCGLAAAAVTAAIGSGIVAAISVAGVLTIPAIRDTVFPTLFGKLGFSESMRQPIGVTPLIYNGTPYIAGFEGMRPESYISNLGDKIVRWTDDFMEGVKMINFFASKAIRDLKNSGAA